MMRCPYVFNSAVTLVWACMRLLSLQLIDRDSRVDSVKCHAQIEILE